MRQTSRSRSPYDKENNSRSANRRANINVQNLRTLLETERKLSERPLPRRSSEKLPTAKKGQHEDIFASRTEKHERMLNLLFIALDEKRLGHLSRNNLSSYRLAMPIFQLLKPILVQIVESSHVMEYRDFKRRIIAAAID